MSLRALGPVVCLSLLLSACCSSKGSPTPTDESSAPVAPTEAPPAAPAPAPNGIPEIPDGRSKPPTVAEWGSATNVNTASKGAQPSNCYMKIVREWLKVHCDGFMQHVTNEEGLGAEGVEHFTWVNDKVADVVVRVRKGQSMKLRIVRDGQTVAMFTNWPAGAPRPTVMALQNN